MTLELALRIYFFLGCSFIFTRLTIEEDWILLKNDFTVEPAANSFAVVACVALWPVIALIELYEYITGEKIV